MAAKNLPAARDLAAQHHDPIVPAILPAIAAEAKAGTDPAAARVLLRESIDRLTKLGTVEFARPSPAVAISRLLPLAARIDPDRAWDYLWRSLSLRPGLAASPEPNSLKPQVRQQFLDLAELAARIARYDRKTAEAIFAPVVDRVASLDHEVHGMGQEGPAIFRAAGVFDAKVARDLLADLPEDPSPPANPGRIRPAIWHRSKAQSRLALAQVLGQPPNLRLREPLIPYSEEGFGYFED